MAGAAKIPDLRGFHVIVLRYGILPDVLAGPFACALPFVEIGIGLYLGIGLFVRGTALAGTLLFTAFLSVQAFAYARGIPLDCGCFGTIARTAVGLGIPTFLMLALPARWLSLDKRLFGSVDRFTIRLGRRSN